ncbi:hypothetical protein BGZ70_007249 [Mortierella alpina]|uniref:SMAD/FHA domain-containing protein n=1 Tax=Mortierella alpina TaxID=64518 RepID=A0A9P6J6S5_MORAP|nr:hypothetical protein BGZ70_007249 [Mortierella alpina]
MSSPTQAHATHPGGTAPASPTAEASAAASGAGSGSNTTTTTPPVPHIRIVPHLDAPRSLHFDVVDKDVPEGFVLKIGRFTDKQALPNRVTFKSKVVSRGHAEIFTENGKFYIRDTKSSSGTFLNHARLSAPGVESKPMLLKDGDVIQLGVDYQGGTQEIYRCVKMRLELNRSWQQQANTFRTNTLKAIRSLTTADAACSTDCCICLFRIASFQSLFVAPCSHVYHYKCIRPMLISNHPGFLCPLCRTFADLDDTVEIDDPIDEEIVAEGSAVVVENGSHQDSVEQLTDPEQHATTIPPAEVMASPNEVVATGQESPSRSTLTPPSTASAAAAAAPSSPQRSDSRDSLSSQEGLGSTDDVVPSPSSSALSSASSSQQRIQSSASATVSPMDITGTEPSSGALVNPLDQQSPASAFFMAPSPPMFVSNFGVSPIPFAATPTSTTSSSPRQEHTPSSPSSHMGHMIQNFVRNITIPHRNRSRTNSHSAASPTTPQASTSHPGGAGGVANGGLVPPSGAEVFGKTLVISPPTMLMASHHRTGHSGHSELGVVSETEGGDGGAAMVAAGGVAMQPAGSSSSGHSHGSSRSSSHSRGGETQGGGVGADLPMALHPSQTVAAEAV